MLFPVLVDLYAALLGLIVGSYLNVVIYRLPRGISTILPRSRCPACGGIIEARDNLPVLSFLLLRGRCRHCRAPISWRYPVVEAANALLFVACAEVFGVSLPALIAALFCSLMIVLAAIDVEHLLLPDRITLPGIAAGVVLQPAIGWAGGPWWGIVGGLLGAALGAGVLLAIYGLWWAIRHEEGMGLGDVKMLAMVGAFLGWKGVLVTLFFGALLGAAMGLALIGLRRAHFKAKLPFGAFLAAGGVIALFFGPPLADAYLRLL